MKHLQLVLGLAACALVPAAALAALAGYMYDRVIGREAELLAALDDELHSWIPA